MNRAALYLIVLAAVAVQRVADLFRSSRIALDHSELCDPWIERCTICGREPQGFLDV